MNGSVKTRIFQGLQSRKITRARPTTPVGLARRLYKLVRPQPKKIDRNKTRAHNIYSMTLDENAPAYYTMYDMKKDILTVRLDAREKRLLYETQKRLGLSCSQVVREAIVRYAAQSQKESNKTAAELLAPWIGKYSSGGLNFSERTGEKVRKILWDRAKRRAR